MAEPEQNSRLPVVMLVLDGWGVSAATEGNAVAAAQAPNMRQLMQQQPSMALQASGTAVGLPWGEAGNSEIGHLNLGAGRIVFQDVPAIATALANGSFFQNKVFIDSVNHAKQYDSALHFIGVLSPEEGSQGLAHVNALLELAQQQQFGRVYLHLLFDKEGTIENSMGRYVKELEGLMQRTGVGRIATVSGEYYAMDREKRWEHTARAYRLMVDGVGQKAASVEAVLNKAAGENRSTEYIEPTVIEKDATIKDNDTIIFFNWRPERARQLAKAFVAPYFGEFEHGKPLKNLYLVSMSSFAGDDEVKAAFIAEPVRDGLAETLSKQGLRQFHIAETEKFAQITTFFNGGVEQPFAGEIDQEVPSLQVQGYDERPEMSASQIIDQLLSAVADNQADFYLANLANCDMVGHTGDFDATVKAVEAVDAQIGRVVAACQGAANLIITADHGNAERMRSPHTGVSNVDHTNDPVPFVLVSPAGYRLNGQGQSAQDGQLPGGMLADVAPTVLHLLGIEKPEAMTGYSLLATSTEAFGGEVAA
jgi:2,3-bisphosphoglycerate-independent phosphoglycerate mutase